MWRLALSQLHGRSMYVGQTFHISNSTKVQVGAIHEQGRLVSSAFFDRHTNPIFRSQSAQFLILIQMSREMWDFNSDGRGEVLFQKAIDGFLPELFSRWREQGSHHLLQIVLFTRMEYEQLGPWGGQEASVSMAHRHQPQDAEKLYYQDFYRTLRCDPTSRHGEQRTMETLKEEMQVFLRDISTQPVSRENGTWGRNHQSSQFDPLQHVRTGHSAPASHGNLLEAIGISCTRFALDPVEVDLFHTGTSVLVLSPGNGFFEVNPELLRYTGDLLFETGISVDLLCLAGAPLHSAPLFACQSSRQDDSSPLDSSASDRGSSDAEKEDLFLSRYTKSAATLLTDAVSQRGGTSMFTRRHISSLGKYIHGIPHWIDVSYWTPGTQIPDKQPERRRLPFPASGQPPFYPRMRMFEVQMMEIMESEISDILLPIFHSPTYNALQDLGRQCSSSDVLDKNLDTAKPPDTKLRGSKESGANLMLSHAARPIRRAGAPLQSPLLDWMDGHDSKLFRRRHPQTARLAHRLGPSSQSHPTAICENRVRIARSNPKSLPSEAPPPTQSAKTRHTVISAVARSFDPNKSRESPPSASSQGQRRTTQPRTTFGSRGFSPIALKATPVAEILSTVALLGAPPFNRSNIHVQQDITHAEDSEGNLPVLGHLLGYSMQQKVESRSPLMQASEKRSQPIAIKIPTGRTQIENLDRTNTAEAQIDARHQADRAFHARARDGEANGSLDLESPKRLASSFLSWFTQVDPSRPRGFKHLRARLGTWHSTHPKALPSTDIKWKSLCAPALLPLTLGDRAAKDLSNWHLDCRYSVHLGQRDPSKKTELSCHRLMSRMVQSRLDHGFQIASAAMASVNAEQNSSPGTILLPFEDIGRRGSSVTMAFGKSGHKLEVSSDSSQVMVSISADDGKVGAPERRQARRMTQPNAAFRLNNSHYYGLRDFELHSPINEPDWRRSDSLNAEREELGLGSSSAKSSLWNARFVFIPDHELTAVARKAAGAEHDNDEEINLEGIKQLSQLWQRNRHVDAWLGEDERKPEDAPRQRRNPNPLDIIYRTDCPSKVVAAELQDFMPCDDKITSEFQNAQVLPEMEHFQRTNLNIVLLAKAIQGKSGIPLSDRRWHFTLYRNCFVGIDLTSWLLANFRDVTSREEAVVLGNELMREGLFMHVRGKHEFRDGNFFYRIARAHSIPPTHGDGNGRSHTPSIVALGPQHPKQNSIDSDLPGGEESLTQEKEAGETAKRPCLVLSKKMLLNIDPRGRSDQPELVNIHYDRIASANECYHVRMDWMNATPALVVDTLREWMAVAERGGLRLVRLPIAEACQITQRHFFAECHLVKLVQPPPNHNTNPDGSQASGNGPREQRSRYQRAILRAFDYVLDLEAAWEFPSSIDVTYSWGRPDYRSSQYVSRQGDVLAQITHDGNFIFLANPLANEKRGVNQENQLLGLSRAQRTQVLPVGSNPGTPTPSIPETRSMHHAAPSTVKTDSPGLTAILAGLEQFCSDASKLQRFYDVIAQEATRAAGRESLSE